jgi:hypothetical protein
MPSLGHHAEGGQRDATWWVSQRGGARPFGEPGTPLLAASSAPSRARPSVTVNLPRRRRPAAQIALGRGDAWCPSPPSRSRNRSRWRPRASWRQGLAEASGAGAGDAGSHESGTHEWYPRGKHGDGRSPGNGKSPAYAGLSEARPERFELPTFGSVDRRSIQLSYGRGDAS